MWTHAHQNSDAPVLSATPSALQACITFGYVRDRNSHVRSCTLLAGSRILSRWPQLRPYVQSAMALSVLISKSHGTIWITYKVVQHGHTMYLNATECTRISVRIPAMHAVCMVGLRFRWKTAEPMPTTFITSSAYSHDLVIVTPSSVNSSAPSCASYHCVRQLSNSASSTQIGTYDNCPSLESTHQPCTPPPASRH
jgi:hypothetical protein